MNRCTGFVVGTFLLTANLTTALADKMPRDFSGEIALQTYEVERAKITTAGTTSFFTGLVGYHPFDLVNPFRADEFRSTFVTSMSPL